MRHVLSDYLLRPHMTESPTDTKFMSRTALLKATGITSRQLTYYTQRGAVARPVGKTRAAKYTVSHLHQVRRVVELLNKYQTTVAQIAEAFAGQIPSARPAKTKADPRPQSSTKLHVLRLSDGIHIMVAEELLPTEKKLLRAILKAGELVQRDRLKLATEVMTREQDLQEQVSGRGRRSGS